MYFKYKHILFCVAVFISTVNYSIAQDKDFEEQSLQKLNRDRERAEEEIANIDKLLKSTGEKQQKSQYELSLIEQKINSRKTALNTIDKQIITLQKQLEEKKQAVEHLQIELEEVKKSYKDLIRRYYNMQSQRNTWVMYIMASESVSQAYKRMKYVREILELLKAQADKITVMTDHLNSEIEEMAKKQILLSSNISDKQKEMEILRMEEKQSKTVYSKLKSEESVLKKQLEERKKAYGIIDEQMRKFMRNEIKEKRESGITDQMLISTRDIEKNKGLLPQPAIGVIVSHFKDDKTSSVYNQVALKTNDGVDILTAENAEVYAVFDGKVKTIFPAPGAGLCVIIEHGSYYTLYAFLKSVSVKKDETVKLRQKIGNVLNSKDGSILHFQIWKDTQPLNPEQWILN